MNLNLTPKPPHEIAYWELINRAGWTSEKFAAFSLKTWMQLRASVLCVNRGERRLRLTLYNGQTLFITRIKQ